MTTPITPTEAASAEHADPELKLDLSKYIETRFFEERPHIRNRRIPIFDLVAGSGERGWNAADLAYQYTISEQEALAAVLYYLENRQAVDAAEAAYNARYPSPEERQHGGG